ncbi:SctD/MshK family protein [Piscinibacter terrae]|uniref:YscD/Y4YQ C-terminal domain-containing protein n=1 Tax=Piscinibacter terrae TaxID=2496871 RepID=A0A3N7HL15_9BURK|nr:hypothetical protein [Albitalea terrae]RQP21261.1 hypothetical protein DZC73_28920 [Albitalea terrae]
MTPQRTLELRVLGGEQQGARCRLSDGLPTTVSGQFDSDIVLRGSDLARRRIAITPQGDGVRLEVLSGDAKLGDRMLAAGESVQLPLYAPVQLGDTVVALGDPEGDWSAPVTHDEAAPAPRRAADVHRWSRRLIMGGGAVATVSMAMLAFAYTAAPAEPTTEQLARRAEAELHAAGFPRLVVKATPQGEISVTGYLETNEERARVERTLASQPATARLSVWVNEQVANSVLDVYRVNGVNAQADVTGPGAVRVTTHEADVGKLEQIRTVARRDVPGLSILEARNAPPPAAPQAAPVLDDPGKRVAAIVPGEPSYVVTADGTRYFEGALLPTGHRIASIADHEVLLERGGSTTPLRF